MKGRSVTSQLRGFNKETINALQLVKMLLSKNREKYGECLKLITYVIDLNEERYGTKRMKVRRGAGADIPALS